MALIGLKNAAKKRKLQKKDKYKDATSLLLRSHGLNEELHYYHAKCYSNYTAVKGNTSIIDIEIRDETQQTDNVTTDEHKKSCIKQRTRDSKSLNENACIFCKKKRKRYKGKELFLHTLTDKKAIEELCMKVECMDDDNLMTVLKNSSEIKYHNTCKVSFNFQFEKTLSEIDMDPLPSNNKTIHNKAFGCLASFVELEILEKQNCFFVSTLMEIYKNQFLCEGGSEENFIVYTNQNLQRKLTEKFGDLITFSCLDSRRGNFVFSSRMEKSEATSRVTADEQDINNKIINVALHLRRKILDLPKTKTPSYVTADTLKQASPVLDGQLNLLLQTLMMGPDKKREKNVETVARKVECMASDIIFNVSRGLVKPWKTLLLGLGIQSMTGSKAALNILNICGHVINYHEVKQYETEIAYSVADSGNECPDGIIHDPHLATGTVWDNNDANIETLDGRDTFHTTVGHCYQNIPTNSCVPRQVEGMNFREERKRRKFCGNNRHIPEFKSSLRKARFTSQDEKAVSIDAKSSLKLSLTDLYWFLKFQVTKFPLYAGFMSTYIEDLLPMQQISFLDPIPMSPTNNDVVRETMVRSINIAKEIKQSHAVVTYDLAVFFEGLLYSTN